MSTRPCHSSRQRQRGLSLVTSLIFMLAILLIGVAALSVSTMQEKMIGNTKDQDLAMQAAEAGLRDAEAYVSNNVNMTTTFSDDCSQGLCNPPSQQATPSGNPINLVVSDIWTNPNHHIVYGSSSGTTFPLVSSQPMYVIEKLGSLGTPAGESSGIGLAPGSVGNAYRITVYATGARPETTVTLQSVFTLKFR